MISLPAWFRRFVILGACAAIAEGANPGIPAEKGLSDRWVRSLRERGSFPTWTGSDLDAVGMPVGGIGAGQLYLRGDGTLACWQIFNRHVFSGTGGNNYRRYRPDSPVAQGLAVVIRKPDGTVDMRRLNRDSWPEVRFTGPYPMASVDYRDPAFPVSVRLQAFSPFIPLNAADSTLPATLFDVAVTNTSGGALDVQVMSWLENAVCRFSEPRLEAERSTRFWEEDHVGGILHSARALPQPTGAAGRRPPVLLADFEGDDYGDWQASGTAFGTGPARGTRPGQQAVSGYAGKGLVNTFLDGDPPTGRLLSPEFRIQRRKIRFLIGGGRFEATTCMQLLVGNEAVRSAHGTNTEQLRWTSWDVGDLAGKTARLRIIDEASGGWGHINVDHIEMADDMEGLPRPAVDRLPDWGGMLLSMEGATAGRATASPQMTHDGVPLPGDGMAWSYPFEGPAVGVLHGPPIPTPSGETARQRLALAWHFPNHANGRAYATRFADVEALTTYLWQNRDRLSETTALWTKTFYEDSTLPYWLLFRLHSTVANLATDTCQYWRNGRFWAWEGVGCCGGTCTHVWNYEHALARLFPALERSIREMQDFGEGFDDATGLVGFRSNRAYAADGQCGTILKAYREHLMSADDRFLRRNWPRIKQALQYVIDRDGNDDGFIEDSQHNTFDINFHGPNTFVGSLYLGAVRAGEAMARELGDTTFADRCGSIAEKGRERTMAELWNGEYFIQKVDLQQHRRHQYGQGCLSDQLFGQGWARQTGIGDLYPAEAVRTALTSIWTYNWAPAVGPYNARHHPERVFALPDEGGLFTCTWPKSDYLPEGVRYRSEIWTGIEYQVAGHMIWEGLVTEGLAICKAIDDRYHPGRRNPYNEIECGDHYARALASWGVYLALAGFEYHGPKQSLAFAPALDGPFRVAFTCAEGWGLFSRREDAGGAAAMVELRYGSLPLRSLALTWPGNRGGTVRVERNGQVVPCTVETRGPTVQLRFRDDVGLSAGDVLVVTQQ